MIWALGSGQAQFLAGHYHFGPSGLALVPICFICFIIIIIIINCRLIMHLGFSYYLVLEEVFQDPICECHINHQQPMVQTKASSIKDSDNTITTFNFLFKRKVMIYLIFYYCNPPAENVLAAKNCFPISLHLFPYSMSLTFSSPHLQLTF